MITLQHYLVLSILLFMIGSIGMVVRRNMLIAVMSMQIMMIGASLSVLAFSRWNLLPEGKAIAMLIVAVSSAIALVGISLVLFVFKRRKSASADELNSLRG